MSEDSRVINAAIFPYSLIAENRQVNSMKQTKQYKMKLNLLLSRSLGTNDTVKNKRANSQIKLANPVNFSLIGDISLVKITIAFIKINKKLTKKSN